MKKSHSSPVICVLTIASLLLPGLCRAVPDRALTFDGVNDYVETNTAVIPASGNFTIELWAECPVAPGSYREILSQGSGSGQLYIGTDASNNILP